jgi:hypothetical protein
MARAYEGITGRISGKVGNKVYRVMNGKTFVSIRPEKYNASNTEAAVSNRTRFASVIKFAKYINSIPEFSALWKSAKIKGTTSFNRIVKHNIKLFSGNSPSLLNLSTPTPGKTEIAFPFSSLYLIPGTRELILNFSKDNEPGEFTLLILYLFKEPVKKKSASFEMHHVVLTISSSAADDIIISPSPAVKSLLKNYKKVIISASVSAMEKGKLYWSCSRSFEFTL